MFRFRLPSTLACLAASFCLGSPASQAAPLVVHNHSDKTLKLVVSYPSSRGWITAGWIEVPGSQIKLFDIAARGKAIWLGGVLPEAQLWASPSDRTARTVRVMPTIFMSSPRRPLRGGIERRLFKVPLESGRFEFDTDEVRFGEGARPVPVRTDPAGSGSAPAASGKPGQEDRSQKASQGLSAAQAKKCARNPKLPECRKAQGAVAVRPVLAMFANRGKSPVRVALAWRGKASDMASGWWLVKPGQEVAVKLSAAGQDLWYALQGKVRPVRGDRLLPVSPKNFLGPVQAAGQKVPFQRVALPRNSVRITF